MAPPQPPSMAQTLELPVGFGIMRTGIVSCIKKNAFFTLAMTSLSASVSPGSSNQVPQSGWLKQQKCIFSVLEAKSLRSIYQRAWFLLRPLSLALRWPSSPCAFTWSSFHKSLCPNLLFSKNIKLD